jgi:hypothetical protein
VLKADDLTSARAVVTTIRARAMAWTAAERTCLGQREGRGMGERGCVAMDVGSKDFGELSGQIEDNARKGLDLVWDAAY